MQVNERHVVSIDVLIGEQSNMFKDLSCKKKHRLTILVGCENQYHGRNQCKKDMQEGGKKMGDACLQKYYFNKKSKRDRIRVEGGLTQRKIGNGITASLCRGRDNSKSYRIHTIDYIEQQPHAKKTQLNNSTIQDPTTKKPKLNKTKLNKKSIISQSDLTQFQTLTKDKQNNNIDKQKDKDKDKDKDIRIKIKQKQAITINLRHRKYNKAKTQFQQACQDMDNNNCSKANNGNRNGYREYVMSERKNKEDGTRKVQFKKNRIRNINTQSQRQTLQLRPQKQSIAGDINSKDHKDIEKMHQNQSKDNFNEYINYIAQNKKEKIVSKPIYSRNPIKSRSFAVKNGNPSLSLRTANCKSSKKSQKQKNQHNLTPDSKGITQRESQQKKNPQQHPPRQLKSSYLDLECSQIPQINQSSFLSSTGKRQIVLTQEFELTKFNNQIKKHNIKQNVLTSQEEHESPKQKRKKKQSKMNLLCRFDMRQAFPEKFFG